MFMHAKGVMVFVEIRHFLILSLQLSTRSSRLGLKLEWGHTLVPCLFTHSSVFD